jgi:hypothetical protein
MSEQDKVAELAVRLTEAGHADQALKLLTAEEKTARLNHEQAMLLGLMLDILSDGQPKTLSEIEIAMRAKMARTGLSTPAMSGATLDFIVKQAEASFLLDVGGRFIAKLDPSLLDGDSARASMRNAMARMGEDALSIALKDRMREVQDLLRSAPRNIRKFWV